ncbi:hypothetical protein ZWY2020_003681 [Hordeum vulgare]|nr:hypothetical protein ZWY2020_003681 [Hordeum vulgare]
MTAAAWPVCTICYEDLRPLSDQHIYCLPSCGHVFHALWSAPHRPSPQIRLFSPVLSSRWPANRDASRVLLQPRAMAGVLPERGRQEEGQVPHLQAGLRRLSPADPPLLPVHGRVPHAGTPSSSQDADLEELAAEVARLEQKASSSAGRSRSSATGSRSSTPRLVVRWKEQAATAETMRESTRKEKESVQWLLNAKTEELSRKTSECVRLQERSLALAKELAALKLSTDMNLQEEEILKLASLGNHGNLENAVDVLKRSLALRNKSYKDLMVQCNQLGRSESRAQQRIDKDRELIKKLRAKVLDLQKELEEKENNVIRDLRCSKKSKTDQNQTNPVNANASNGFSSPSAGYGNQTVKLDDVMQDGCNEKAQLNEVTPEVKKDLILEDKDVIDLDADDKDKIKCPTKPFGYNDYTSNTRNQSSRCERDTKEPTTFGCEPSFYVPEETSLLKHTTATGKSTFQEILMKTKLQNIQELPVLRSMNVTTSPTCKKESLTMGGISKQATRLASGTGPQTFHNLNSFLVNDDFQTLPGCTGEGARKGIGKWSKGVTAPGYLGANTNKGNLIAVGPDGRGGKVKVLRGHGRFPDSRTPALWPKAQQKAGGGKGGQSNLEHFFVKR